jgi:hypothetical protein
MTKQDELTAGLQAELARVNARLAEEFCDKNCVWTDHHPECDKAKPEPPPECKTEAEKTAFAFGWWKALETVREKRPVKTYSGGKPWVGLSEDEINKLRHLVDWTAEWSYGRFAYELERLLREKNGGAA